jgi:hypothetical protein
LMPKYSRSPGPRLGATFGDWTLKTLEGETRTSKQMPPEYVMLFAAEACASCHTLFGQLAHSGRTRGPLVVAAEGEAPRLARAATTPNGPLYDEFLAGADLALMQRLEIPSTPFAVAIRQGHVMASGPARTPEELEKIGDMLRPASAPGPLRA